MNGAIATVQQLKESFRTAFAKKADLAGIEQTIQILEKYVIEDEQQRRIEWNKQIESINKRLNECSTLAAKNEKELDDLETKKIQEVLDRVQEKVDYEEYDQAIQTIQLMMGRRPERTESQEKVY